MKPEKIHAPWNETLTYCGLRREHPSKFVSNSAQAVDCLECVLKKVEEHPFWTRRLAEVKEMQRDEDQA